MVDPREEISLATDYWREQMPEEVRQMIAMARWDIRSGPCDAEDWPGWATALATIRNFLDQITDIDVEVDFDPETEISETEPIAGSAEEIKRQLLGQDEAGRQLFAML